MLLSTRYAAIAVAIGVLLCFAPPAVNGQCGIPYPSAGWDTQVVWGTHLWRVGFNNVESYSGVEVDGPYWYNWYKYVSASVSRNSTQLYSGAYDGFNYSYILQWNDSPSSTGTGTYQKSSYHYTSCGSYAVDDTLNASLTVNQPTIGNLPYNNGLWYFGPGTPGAVPIGSGGYAYQYAYPTFNTNCGTGDVCTGTPQWTHIGSGYVSLSCTSCSSPTLTSIAAGTCNYDDGVSASMAGFSTDTTSIMVNAPKFFATAQSSATQAWNSGYQTFVYWYVKDECSSPNLVPSVAMNEQFGTFQNPGVIAGWTDPSPGNPANFNDGTYEVYDTVGAYGSTWNPTPTYSQSGPPYTYNTLLKYAPQSWYVGTQTFGYGISVFSGTISYYQDHGNSQ